MYCKYLKLTNGDNIMVMTEDRCDNLVDKKYLDVKDPVLINSIRFPRGHLIVETFVLQPWLRMAKTDMVKIPVHTIVVAADVQDPAAEQYKKYLLEMPEESNQEIPATEDEEQDIIEQMLSGDEEEENYDRNTDTRTLH